MGKTRTLLILLFSTVLLGFTFQTPFKSISNNKISILYPSNWDLLTDPQHDILVQEKAKTKNDAVLCSFIVDIDSIHTTIETYLPFYKSKMVESKTHKNWRIESQKQIKVRCYGGIEIISNFEIGEIKCKNKAVLVKHGDRIINLNMTSSEANFITNMAISYNMFESVVFIK